MKGGDLGWHKALKKKTLNQIPGKSGLKKNTFKVSHSAVEPFLSEHESHTISQKGVGLILMKTG